MLKRIAELQASLPLPQLMQLPPAISSSIQPVQAAPPPPVLPSLLPPAALPSLSSSAQLSEEPLLTGRHKGLSPEEAYHQLTQATRYTNNLQTIGTGKGGEVYLMKSSNQLTSKDWKKSNYQFTAEKGKLKIHAKQDKSKSIYKTTSILVTNTKKKGDNRFRRYSWQLEDDPLTVLIQYVGDETIKTLNFHGNCKSVNPRPINQLLPSVREEIVNSPKSAARIYEDMRVTAGTTPYQQSKFAPNNKSQVKNLQRMERKRKREAIGDEVGPAPAPAPAPLYILTPV